MNHLDDIDDRVTFTVERGVARMILMGAKSDADLWARSNGSTELKSQWSKRAVIIRDLLAKLPAPVNPRDPYEDLPGEPTPEEAEVIWRERAATEDARQAARVAAAARRPVEETPAAPTPPIPDDIEDLLAL